MSREDEFKAIMIADTTPVVGLMAILTGGVYTRGAIGMEGITRETTPAAFSGGYLLPCVLIVQAGRIPTGDIEDYTDQSTSATQRVETWLYEDRGYTSIDAAAQRMYELLQGDPATDGFEIRLANDIDRQRDEGSLDGASLRRLDWQVISIIQ